MEGVGDQYTAYFYRETWYESSNRISVTEVNDNSRTALFMDYNIQGGAGSISMHKFEWVNVLHRDGAAKGAANDGTVGNKFTTDFSNEANESVWALADSTY